MPINLREPVLFHVGIRHEYIDSPGIYVTINLESVWEETGSLNDHFPTWWYYETRELFRELQLVELMEAIYECNILCRTPTDRELKVSEIRQRLLDEGFKENPEFSRFIGGRPHEDGDEDPIDYRYQQTADQQNASQQRRTIMRHRTTFTYKKTGGESRKLKILEHKDASIDKRRKIIILDKEETKKIKSKNIKTYRITFHRENFGFKPPLNQSVDVVFETDIPNTDEHIEKFEEAAFNALLKQVPCFANSKGPIAESDGWSSILSNNKYIEI